MSVCSRRVSEALSTPSPVHKDTELVTSMLDGLEPFSRQ